MSHVIRQPGLFTVAAQLRAFAAREHIPTTRINLGTRAAKVELDAGRTEVVAQLAGEKAMRVETHNHQPEGTAA